MCDPSTNMGGGADGGCGGAVGGEAGGLGTPATNPLLGPIATMASGAVVAAADPVTGLWMIGTGVASLAGVEGLQRDSQQREEYVRHLEADIVVLENDCAEARRRYREADDALHAEQQHSAALTERLDEERTLSAEMGRALFREQEARRKDKEKLACQQRHGHGHGRRACKGRRLLRVSAKLVAVAAVAGAAYYAYQAWVRRSQREEPASVLRRLATEVKREEEAAEEEEEGEEEYQDEDGALYNHDDGEWEVRDNVWLRVRTATSQQ